MSGQLPVFLGSTSNKQRIMYLAQGHIDTVSTVSLKLSNSFVFGQFPVFLDSIRTKRKIMYLAQGNKAVPAVSLEPVTL